MRPLIYILRRFLMNSIGIRLPSGRCMSETPEGKVKRKVKELLVQHGVYFFCPVQMGMGSRTLDFLCCHRGIFFAIETKAPGKTMTEQQCAIAQRIEQSQGTVFCISCTDPDSLAWGALVSWLNLVSDGMTPTGFVEPSPSKAGTSRPKSGKAARKSRCSGESLE